MEKTRKWRWGVNRWIVLGLIILSVVATKIAAPPVQPSIQVAAENVSHHPLFTLPFVGDFYLTNTMVAMLLMDVVILLIAFAVKRATSSKNLAPKGIAAVMEMAVEAMYNLTETTAGKWTKKIFPWFATILILVLFANLLKLLPGFESIGLLEESSKGVGITAIGGHWYTLNPSVTSGETYIVAPFIRGLSTDLNFTLALALIAVVMTQIIGVEALGIRYFSKFLNFTTMFKKPFLGFMDFLVGLLEIISEFSKILSFTFRLFGNMFAGMVLMALVGAMVPIFVPSMIMAFELFIGAIQAFVFGMLTMVFMAQATQGHSEEAHS